MDENNISGENEEVKKEPIPPTVEVLPDLNETEPEGKTAPVTVPSPCANVPEKKENAPRAQVVQKRGVPTGAFITVLILAVVATFMVTYVCLFNSFQEKFDQIRLMYAETAKENLSSLNAKLKAIDGEIRASYLYDIDEETLEDCVLEGYIWGVGDKYAEYFNREEMEELIADSNAEMQGIGVSVVYNADEAAIEIINVFPDSPAGKAGLLPGDLICYVITDGDSEDSYVSVAELGYTTALNSLRGEAGTVARFVAYRDRNFDDPMEYSITREFVTEYSVTSEICAYDKTVGIINISSFDSKTPEQFRKAIEDVTANGAEKLVFDVRNNPGGELDSVCAILDMLLPEGPVIRTVDKAGNEETVYVSDEEELKMPMAVVTNGNTASAGELFTAALRDYGKAKIYGETTYGKGSMQTVKTFPDGTGFKYTYRYYCPPFSDNYDGVGITPDVTVKLGDEAAKKNIYTLTDDEDTQLHAAVDSFQK